MVLYCYACTLGGTRIHKEALVAVIDEKSVKLPLFGSMFLSINPERGYPQPWSDEATWQHMKCIRNPAHLPWEMDPIKAEKAMKNGGPSELLTDQGWIKLNEKGISRTELGTESNGSTYTNEKLVSEWEKSGEAKTVLEALSTEAEAITPENLKTYLAKRGISINRFAKALNVSQPFLSMVLNGKKRFPEALKEKAKVILENWTG